jgi:hypothetical protein
VQPDSKGGVQISFDETRRRVVEGALNDDAIQRLLLVAAREQDSGVRVEAVETLKSQSESSEVRDALLNRLVHDPNPGVRLKALEGLGRWAGDADVRKTLAQVLNNDDNARIRMQVADLLVAHRDDSLVGMLQSAVQREDNEYVRLKIEKALKEANASVGTF